MPSPTSTAACARTRPDPPCSPRNVRRPSIRLLTFSSDQVFDGLPPATLGRERHAGPAQRLRSQQGQRRARRARGLAAGDGRPYECLLRSVGLAQLRHPDARRPGARRRGPGRVRRTYLADLRSRPRGCLSRSPDRRRMRDLASRQRRRRQLGRTRRARRRRCRRRARPACAALPQVVSASSRPRPAYGVLASERAALMPTLDDALARFCAERAKTPVPPRQRLVGRRSGRCAARPLLIGATLPSKPRQCRT